ncbi:RsmB/NOP family class I SAM-dependent RNA methyltransferase [Oceanidesulfovibrio marinus]|uniref:RsmB/NOP family class I SAM-dependent RNA methyltransferase n=2 Tax=Oceanidesulfovibrio marinus TaxID=370038 RepID=A0A6P1ZN61_9BACT|nr:RsmB/NOP family class I SAM-dependent RNA methyltransferase [Oceanidesulfovibrio marinus]
MSSRWEGVSHNNKRVKSQSLEQAEALQNLRKNFRMLEDQGRSFRLICQEWERPMLLELLAAEGYTLEPLPAHPLLMRASGGEAALGSSLAARFGRLYIQDAASFIAPLALDPRPGETVLDMCASPGGKSTFLAQLAGPDGVVMANEPNPQRLATLRQNILRLSMANVASLDSPGEKLPIPDGSLNAILLDPPCSGWGTAEKHPRVRELWQGDKVEPLKTLQRKLLKEAIRVLAPGGRLVYSTCTTNVEENEAQVLHAVETYGMRIDPIASPPGYAFDEPELDETPGVLRVAGELSAAQGHFVARMVKPGDGLAAAPEHDDDAVNASLEALERKSGVVVDVDEVPGAEHLPAGELVAFKGQVRFLPRAVLATLRPGTRWQGMALGRLTAGGFRVQSRCRALMSPSPGAEALNVTETEPLEDLLAGRGHFLDAPARTKPLPLYYRGLALGWLAVKGDGRRVLWTEK